MKTKGEAFWARIAVADTKFEHQWKVELRMNKEEADKLTAVGLKPKKQVDDNDNIYYSYTFRRYVKRRGSGGGQNSKPMCVDPGLKAYSGLIGNGSQIVVLHKPYNWDFKGRKGVSTDLCGVQIIKLIEYAGTTAGTDGDEAESFEVLGDSFDKADGEEELFEAPAKDSEGEEDPF